MEKLAENDLIYFYLRHVVIVVTAATTISLTPVKYNTPVIQDRYLPKTNTYRKMDRTWYLTTIPEVEAIFFKLRDNRYKD